MYENTPRPHDTSSSQVQVDMAGLSHPGLVRDNNEDHFLAVRMNRSLEIQATNLVDGILPESFNETAYGVLVADGMCGIAAGEVASSIALLKLLELVVHTPDWVMRMNGREDASIVMHRMTRRFRQIDDQLREESEKNPELFGMGTTLTVAASLGNTLFISHIGDSRAYLLRGEKLHQLTNDHTLAQALVAAGIAEPSDTSTQAMRHVLTAALGSSVERSDPEVQRFHLRDGDQLLLCTDGLSEMVTDEDITSLLQGTGSSALACQGLINFALAGGGKDNITVVLLRFLFPQDD